MTVNVEAMIVSFLLGQSDVTDICEDRVYTDLPHQRTYPMVVVTRVGGGSIYKNWLEAAELEINAYGGTHKVAYQLAAACLSTMADDLVGEHAEGVATKIKLTVSAYDPDADSADQAGHARPRYTVSATVTAHP